MKTLPSKELMGKVLLDIEKEEICTYELCWGRDIKYSIIFKDSNNDGTFYYEDDKINIYELAFLIRDYFHKKYKHDLDMSLEINEIFKNATQFYEMAK